MFSVLIFSKLPLLLWLLPAHHPVTDQPDPALAPPSISSQFHPGVLLVLSGRRRLSCPRSVARRLFLTLSAARAASCSASARAAAVPPLVAPALSPCARRLLRRLSLLPSLSAARAASSAAAAPALLRLAPLLFRRFHRSCSSLSCKLQPLSAVPVLLFPHPYLECYI